MEDCSKSAWGDGLPTKSSKSEWGLTGSELVEEGCWERRSDFFQGGSCKFYIKSKLKSEIFNDKKILQVKNISLCHNYEFKLGILPKNLVTFKK